MDVSFAALKVARLLAQDGRVVLVGLGPTDGAISAASNEPSAPGLADLADGSASFRDIITKDVASGVHLISSGEAPANRSGILSSPRLPTSFDALAHSYDYLVIAAGAAVGPELEIISAIAPRALLVAEMQQGAKIASATERLIAAGFDEVTVLVETPGGAEALEAAAA
jgi:Mrp family chromosome partitioning ATPase